MSNREEMTESLQRFGMSDEAIAKVWESEDMIAANAAAKRRANRQKVSAPALDFGDWSE
ncbi:hypothetical protein SEA_BIG4_40 [Microbacterium phage Big4]|nr:hypothetical protein SEA_BIG4_40 [Microbacterium phage Big4]